MVHSGPDRLGAQERHTDAEPSADLRPFWVSWYQDLSIGFELHTPWWVSGWRMVSEDVNQGTICAAIMATSEDDAQRRVVAAHDREPHHLEFRFVNEQEPGWTPFCDRFERADWMRWP